MLPVTTKYRKDNEPKSQLWSLNHSIRINSTLNSHWNFHIDRPGLKLIEYIVATLNDELCGKLVSYYSWLIQLGYQATTKVDFPMAIISWLKSVMLHIDFLVMSSASCNHSNVQFKVRVMVNNISRSLLISIIFHRSNKLPGEFRKTNEASGLKLKASYLLDITNGQICEYHTSCKHRNLNNYQDINIIKKRWVFS